MDEDQNVYDYNNSRSASDSGSGTDDDDEVPLMALHAGGLTVSCWILACGRSIDVDLYDSLVDSFDYR